MAWIEFHQGLSQHHKIRRLRRALGIGIAAAVGHMGLLWTWALDAAPDGDLSAFLPVDIAEQAEWEGDPQAFVDALVAAGLVDVDGDRLSLHDWMDYAGRLVDKRRSDAERKRMSRGRPSDIHGTAQVTVPNRTVPNQEDPMPGADAPGELAPFEDGPLPATPDDDPDLEEAKAAAPPVVPEKFRAAEHPAGTRRGEPAPKPRDGYSDDFEAFWAAYPNRRRSAKPQAYKFWKRALVGGATAEEIMAGLARWKASKDWAKDGGEFVCGPAKWLHPDNRFWEDEPEPASSSPSKVVNLPIGGTSAPSTPAERKVADWLRLRGEQSDRLVVQLRADEANHKTGTTIDQAEALGWLAAEGLYPTLLRIAEMALASLAARRAAT